MAHQSQMTAHETVIDCLKAGPERDICLGKLIESMDAASLKNTVVAWEIAVGKAFSLIDSMRRERNRLSGTGQLAGDKMKVVEERHV